MENQKNARVNSKSPVTWTFGELSSKLHYHMESFIYYIRKIFEKLTFLTPWYAHVRSLNELIPKRFIKNSETTATTPKN